MADSAPKTVTKEDINKNKTNAILCYLGILIIIPFLNEEAKKSPFVQFHLNQGLVLLIGGVIVGAISWIPIIGWIIGIAWFVIWIMALISAASGELMRPQQQPPDVTKQVFEIVEKIAPMMAGGDGGGSPWMMALTQFKEPILKIVDSIQIALQRPSVVPSGPPPQVHAHVQPNPPQPKEEDMLKLLIRQYLPVFINAARQNGNPDIYADMILEQIPQTMYPKLQQWLSTPVWFDDVKSHDPIVIEAQAGWWNLLRGSLLEGMKPDAASDLQPASDSELGED
jgi:uncharacterized membrane protein